MKKLIETCWNALSLLAAADVEYWMARQYLADPEVADLIALSLVPGLHPAQRVTLYCGSSMSAAHAEAHAALLEVEALLAAARRDHDLVASR